MSFFRKRAAKWALIFGLAFAVYFALAFGMYYWKEYMPHNEAGVVSDLDALHVIQQNYKAEHGYYARTFSQLGVPLGAKLVGDQLYWDGPYVFHIVDIKPIGAEGALGYHFEGRPTTYSFGSRRSYLMDEAGRIHFTYEARAANLSDRLDNPN
jgi:hypothetical protein